VEAVNYIASHDIAGFGKERLYDFLQNNDIYDKEQHTKLAFMYLLTAVSIEMIFASKEFCARIDRHYLEKCWGQEKQIDPVNFSKTMSHGFGEYLATIQDPWACGRGARR
jgi:pullulanase